MYAGVVAGMLVASQLPFLSAVARDYGEPRAVLVAGGLICLLGAIDDRWPLDALTKLAGQVACAGVMVLLGVQLSFALLPSGNTLSLTAETAIPLTIFVVVVLVNAVNMVDGLDGLAAGVCAVAALAGFAYAYHLAVSNQIYRATPAALIAVVTAGACVGFLPHNFYPARVFMGDSGSMMIGLLLAASMTSVTGEVSYGGVAGTSALPSLIPLAVPLAVLAVPFLDLLLAVVRRTRRGRPRSRPTSSTCTTAFWRSAILTESRPLHVVLGSAVRVRRGHRRVLERSADHRADRDRARRAVLGPRPHARSRGQMTAPDRPVTDPPKGSDWTATRPPKAENLRPRRRVPEHSVW